MSNHTSFVLLSLGVILLGIGQLAKGCAVSMSIDSLNQRVEALEEANLEEQESGMYGLVQCIELEPVLGQEQYDRVTEAGLCGE